MLIALLLLQTALAGAPCQDVVCVEVEKTAKAVTGMKRTAFL